jgi:tryptophan-rich sensory protein
VMKASENIFSTTYFVSDSCQVDFPIFIKPEWSPSNWVYKLLWMARIVLNTKEINYWMKALTNFSRTRWVSDEDRITF